MFLLTLMALACRSDDQPDSNAQPELLLSEDDPCLAVLGGPGSLDSEMGDWSRAHATWRFFGPTGDWLAADQALVDSLEQDGQDFAAYAAGVDEACLVDAVPELGPAQVVMVDLVAWVTPGTGAVEIPSDAEWVVLDLSDFPAGEAADEALLQTLAQLVGSELSLGRMTQRGFEGHPDNWSEGVYGSSLVQERLLVEPKGRELALAVWMGPEGSPMAHRIAAALRLQERALLLGHDAHAALAESTWAPAGERGLVLRTGLLDFSDQAWPDRVPADLAWGQSEVDVSALNGVSWTVLPTESTRSEIQPWDAQAGYLPADLNPGAMQASFVIAHGVLDRFWPYAEVTGTDLDASLDAALLEIEGLAPEDRPGMEAALGHFMNTLDDGHGFYSSFGVAAPASTVLDLQIQKQGEQVLVRASDEPGVFAGDEIVAVDGVPATEWFQEAMSRRSAATDGYRFDLACREMKRVVGTRTLTLRALDGSERDVELSGSAAEDAVDVPWGGTFRESGPMDELGAPEIYYLNLNGDIEQSQAEVLSHLRELEAEGLVVDVRDYPSVNHYAVVTWLCTGTVTTAWFGTPIWQGPNQGYIEDSNYELACESGAFQGPISWLVSNKTVSAAENFSQMLVGRDNVSVFGQQSAATNGNITLAFLPGGLFIYFTGMRILNPDESVFHGVGIQPDTPVDVTAQDFADGRDPELEAAVQALLE